MSERFILRVAFAKTDLDELVTIGPVEFEGFIQEFRRFDWAGEVIQEYWSKKSTPSMGVTNQCDGSTLWTAAWDWISLLSPSGKPSQTPALTYVVKLNDGPTPPDIYCRKEDRDIGDCAFDAGGPDTVEELFSLFFNEKYGELYRSLYRLRIRDL